MDNTFPKRMILTRDECSALKIPRWWAGVPLDRLRLYTIRKNKK